MFDFFRDKLTSWYLTKETIDRYTEVLSEALFETLGDSEIRDKYYREIFAILLNLLQSFIKVL